jgi:hypothetical protein
MGLFKFTLWKIQRKEALKSPKKITKKTKMISCSSRVSFQTRKEMVLESNTIKTRSSTKAILRIINIMDGESPIITKDNGSLVENAVTGGIRATTRSGIAKRTSHMKGTGQIIDLMDLEPRILPWQNQINLPTTAMREGRLMGWINSILGNGTKALSMDVESR